MNEIIKRVFKSVGSVVAATIISTAVDEIIKELKKKKRGKYYSIERGRLVRSSFIFEFAKFTNNIMKENDG